MTPAFRRVGRLDRGYDVALVDEFFRRGAGQSDRTGPVSRTDLEEPVLEQQDGRAGTGTGTGTVPGRGTAPGTGTGTGTAAWRGRGPVAAQEVRLAAFPLRRHGYDVAQVDAALNRLEDRAAARERQRLVDAQGDEALLGQLGRLAASLDGRLARPPGRRFRRGRRLARGYHPGDVDAVCDRIRAYLDDGATLSVDDVRGAVFRCRRGRRGYREADVDALLDRAITLLLAVG